jgi:formylglycine-generating enzyme required for sulfatase activity
LREQLKNSQVKKVQLQRVQQAEIPKDEEVKLQPTEVKAPLSTFQDCPDCPEMVVIPAGSFDMGSNYYSDEKPIHHVNIDKAFALGKTEVTQGQWKAVTGSNPSDFKECGDNCPVENVSWNDAQEFINKLNNKSGKQYRLPSEAEWEYACRGGRQQRYCGSDDIDSVAWYSTKSDRKTHPVEGKSANDFGLYDMSGNVWEWVQDGYHDSYQGAPTDGSVWEGKDTVRVLRGGSWNNYPEDLRAATRGWDDAAVRYLNLGFRLARMLP